MRILVTGKSGQVGWELQRSLQCVGEVVAVDRATFDLARPALLPAQLDEIRPDVIVNAAAYTAVDMAEREEEVANIVNGESVGLLAQWAAKRGALLVHYSTDYVFDGSKNTPYFESDEPRPINAYGRSKLLGEVAIKQSGCDYLLLRTTWVFSSRGKNFLLTMLRMATQPKEIRVVADQRGAPTWSRTIGDVTAHLIHEAINRRRSGNFTSQVLNVASSGSTSWFQFAETIFAEATKRGILATDERRTLRPVSSLEYLTGATRPANSMLSLSTIEKQFGLVLPFWDESVRLCLDELKSTQ